MNLPMLLRINTWPPPWTLHVGRWRRFPVLENKWMDKSIGRRLDYPSRRAGCLLGSRPTYLGRRRWSSLWTAGPPQLIGYRIPPLDTCSVKADQTTRWLKVDDIDECIAPTRRRLAQLRRSQECTAYLSR